MGPLISETVYHYEQRVATIEVCLTVACLSCLYDLLLAGSVAYVFNSSTRAWYILKQELKTPDCARGLQQKNML